MEYLFHPVAMKVFNLRLCGKASSWNLQGVLLLNLVIWKEFTNYIIVAESVMAFFLYKIETGDKTTREPSCWGCFENKRWRIFIECESKQLKEMCV